MRVDDGDCFCDENRAFNNELRDSSECKKSVIEKNAADKSVNVQVIYRKFCNADYRYGIIGDAHCDTEWNVEDCKYDFLDCIETSSIEF